jgi:3-methyladenine DNA glycosylase/8-oxoguanine DNA glycosylase
MPVPAALPVLRRVWRPGREVDLLATWGTLHRGAGDPTWRRRGDWLFRGISTSTGAATLGVCVRPSHGEVLAQGWGEPEVVRRLLDTLPMMLGAGDDPSGFHLHHRALRLPALSRPGWRVPRTGLVMESLVPAIIEQKVTGREAFASQHMLVRRFGSPAPGPGAAMGLFVPPTPAEVGAIASWEWLRMGVTPQRSDTVMRVVRVAEELEERALTDPEHVSRRLRAVPGVGLWTAAETAQRALGQADAVSFGDYHVAKNIGWALTGTPVDDAGLVELLEPYRPHRYRVQRLVELGGLSRPRRAPRMPVPKHLPTR